MEVTQICFLLKISSPKQPHPAAIRASITAITQNGHSEGASR
jgi:hypothetical protein